MSDNFKENYTVEVEYDEKTGHRTRECWFIDGALHRLGAPAVRKFNRHTGSTIQEEFWENGERHCSYGPAVITRDENTGSIIQTAYYTRGIKQEPFRGPVID